MTIFLFYNFINSFKNLFTLKEEFPMYDQIIKNIPIETSQRLVPNPVFIWKGP